MHPFGGIQGVTSGKKTSGVDPELTGGPFSCAGAPETSLRVLPGRYMTEISCYACCSWQQNADEVNERNGGWLEGRTNIDFDKGCSDSRVI